MNGYLSILLRCAVSAPHLLHSEMDKISVVTLAYIFRGRE